MKSRIAFVLILLSGAMVSAQPNVYFEHQPVWQVSKVCAVPYPCIRNEFVNYLVGSDTVMNGQVYKKIYENSQGYFSWQSPPPAACSGTFSSVDTLPSYYMRSADKKMFMRLPGDTAEVLLYDFNLSIGQALPITYNNFSPDILVTSIDSIYTPYGYRKKFLLNGAASAQFLLEGIGSSNGFIEYIPLMLECGYNLACFSYNDTSYFPSSGMACNLMVGQQAVNESIQIDVSPNPFYDRTMLYASYGLRNAALSIWNGQGQLVFEQYPINGNRCEIQGSNFLPGIYLAKLIQEGKVVTTKRLVILE
jgi:hypothetical protein